MHIDWLVLGLGVVVGAVVAFLLTGMRLAQMTERCNRLAEDNTNKNALLQENQSQLREFQAIQAEKGALEKQINEFKDWKADQQKLLEAQFKVLSQETLGVVKNQLIAENTEKQELLKTNVTQLLKPLTDMQTANEKKLKEFSDMAIAHTTSLKTQIELSYQQTQDLIQTKNSLVEALRGSKGRGDWGELELIRLLEDSGLQKGIHYEFQPTQENNARPDIKIKLPNNNILYIDAKTLLFGLEQIHAASNEEEEQEKRKKLTQDLNREILKLQSKDYQSEGNTVDFVILYVPRESMLRIPLEEDPTLIQRAARNGIILASPLILMAVLKTVAQGWHQSQLAEYAHVIESMGKELHQRAATFLERFEKVGKKIQDLAKQFEETEIAFKGNQGFIRQLNKFERYGCKSTKKIIPERYKLVDIADEEEIEVLEDFQQETFSGAES